MKISIRFQRGLLSHEIAETKYAMLEEFQPAFITAFLLTYQNLYGFPRRVAFQSALNAAYLHTRHRLLLAAYQQSFNPLFSRPFFSR